MPALTNFTDLTHIFEQLSDATRLRIMLRLAQGESNVLGLSEELHLRHSVISHHLGLLRINRLVVGKRNGKQVIYSLTPHVKGGKVKISLPPYRLTVEKK